MKDIVNPIAAWGGVVASIVILVVGVGAVIAGAVGYSDVRDRITQENITGSPDMSPEGERSGVVVEADLPDCDIAEEPVTTGGEAHCFADWMRVHALESTDGLTYAEMPRFLDEDGNGVEDEADAATDPDTGAPVSNELRNTWINQTALATSLNTAFFAESVAKFAFIMGFVLILAGIGFLVLTGTTLLRRSD